MHTTAAELLERMTPAAAPLRQRPAVGCGLRSAARDPFAAAQTRIMRLRMLEALASAAGFRLVAGPAGAGFDPGILQVRVLSRSIWRSKLARFGDADREDIEILAREKLIDPGSLCKRWRRCHAGAVDVR